MAATDVGAVGQQALELLKKEAASLDGWEEVETKDDVRILRKPLAGSDYSFMRGEGDVNFPAQKVFDFATKDGEIRLSWCGEKAGGDLSRSEVIKKIDDNTEIAYRVLKGPPMVSNRDMVLVKVEEKAADGTLTSAAASVDFADAPAPGSNVRAHFTLIGFIVKPLSETSCHISYVMHGDPKGWIPTGVVKSAQLKGPLMINRIRVALAKLA